MINNVPSFKIAHSFMMWISWGELHTCCIRDCNGLLRNTIKILGIILTPARRDNLKLITRFPAVCRSSEEDPQLLKKGEGITRTPSASNNQNHPKFCGLYSTLDLKSSRTKSISKLSSNSSNSRNSKKHQVFSKWEPTTIIKGLKFAASLTFWSGKWFLRFRPNSAWGDLSIMANNLIK